MPSSLLRSQQRHHTDRFDVGQDGILDGILRRIGNPPSFVGPIANRPQVTNLPHTIGINFVAKPRCATFAFRVAHALAGAV
jgi:hypothetical protein